MQLVCLTLGRLYDGQLDFAHAEATYKKGLEFARAFGPPDSWYTSLMLEELASEYTDGHRQGDAKPLLQHALAIRQLRAARAANKEENKTAMERDQATLKKLSSQKS
jgi:hypothetical protein